MGITRRGLMFGAAALAVLGGVWAQGRSTPVPRAERQALRRSRVSQLLFRRLDYLSLDPGGVEAFVLQLTTRRPEDLRALAASGTDPVLRAALEDEIVVLYLRSTDFFWNGGDESRVVRFTRYHDPYSAACGNPFARLSASASSPSPRRA